MNKTFILIATLFVITTSCTTRNTMDDFTYTYSMENPNNFKIELQLNSDSTFKITQYNFFFDNYEGAMKPISSEGILNCEEFSTFKNLLQKSNINEMNDSYGFDDKSEAETDILYMIELKQNGISKYVTINAIEAKIFPENLSELISYTNTIISAKLNVK